MHDAILLSIFGKELVEGVPELPIKHSPIDVVLAEGDQREEARASRSNGWEVGDWRGRGPSGVGLKGEFPEQLPAEQGLHDWRPVTAMHDVILLSVLCRELVECTPELPVERGKVDVVLAKGDQGEEEDLAVDGARSDDRDGGRGWNGRIRRSFTVVFFALF